MNQIDIEKFELRQKISTYAKSIGFDLVGFSPAKIEGKYLKAFDEWLEKGCEGEMEYMRKIEQRRDLSKILPGAKSVIVFGLNYYHEQPDLPRGHGRVARYAYGRDYHKVIGKKLKMIEKFIQEIAENPPLSSPLTKSYVDTGPILERALAEQSGIGRIGKNGCVISKEFGSWIFLSEIITTLDLNFSINNHHQSLPAERWSDPSAPSFNVCGNCNKCMTSCPTGAIIAPGVVDARLCISYLTIENKKSIPPRLAKIIKKTRRLYGCDICQEVCPHQTRAQRAGIATREPKLSMDGLFTPIAGDSLELKTLRPAHAKTTKQDKSPIRADAAFLQTFAGSPIMRAKRKGLKRNAKIINVLRRK